MPKLPITKLTILTLNIFLIFIKSIPTDISKIMMIPNNWGSNWVYQQFAQNLSQDTSYQIIFDNQSHKYFEVSGSLDQSKINFAINLNDTLITLVSKNCTNCLINSPQYADNLSFELSNQEITNLAIDANSNSNGNTINSTQAESNIS